MLGFKHWLDGKFVCTGKLLGLKNWLDKIFACTKNLLRFKNWRDGNVTKKRGSENTQHIDCHQRTQVSMFSWSTPHSSNLRKHTAH